MHIAGLGSDTPFSAFAYKLSAKIHALLEHFSVCVRVVQPAHLPRLDPGSAAA